MAPPDDDDDLRMLASIADAARARMRTRHGPQLEQAGALLESVHGAAQQATGAAINGQAWNAIVGPRIAERTRPGRARDGVLFVETASSSWAAELSFLSTDILTKLRARGYGFTQLRFIPGVQASAPKPKVAEVRVVRRPAGLPAELERKLALIEDSSLRASISEAAGYSLSRAATLPPTGPQGLRVAAQQSALKE